jgi:DNA-binding response OmpR family regulator
MKGLRHKLKQAGAPADFIETVYGIGYRLKVPTSSSPKSTQASTTTPQQALRKQTQTALTLMWHKHHDKARDRIAVLEQAKVALQANALERKLRQKAVLAAHKLAGALGVFGFAEGSQIAGEIEQQLQSTATFSPQEVAHFSERVDALRQSIAVEPPQPQAPSVRQLRPLLIAVDDDPELAELILREALALKIRAKLLPDLAAARKTLETLSQTAPTLDVLVLSFSLATTAEANLRDLAKLAKQPPPVPVLLFTDRDNLTDRVKAAQFGAHVVIQKPQRPAQVLATITSILNQGQATNAKVMVVDDDPQVLAAIRSLLEPWGLELIALNDPFQFWAMLEKFSPDLLVLDVEMPHFSGIELCQVVRNDPRWFRLPILFFSVHTDAGTVRQILTAGADEYVSKATVSSELVTRVLNRLERVRLLQSMN